MEEIWKPVIGYEDTYLVSNLGRVKSIVRYVKGRGVGLHRAGGKILATTSVGTGYKGVKLSRENNARTEFVHRLVAKAFISNSKNLKEVNHKNGNKADNRVCNLEWVSRSENGIHAYAHGLKHKAGGTPPKRVLLTNGEWRKEFDSIADAATYAKISQSSISRSCSGLHPYFHKTFRAYYL